MPCLINQCRGKVSNKGLCGKHHYEQWRQGRDERFKPWQFDQLMIPGLAQSNVSQINLSSQELVLGTS